MKVIRQFLFESDLITKKRRNADANIIYFPSQILIYEEAEQQKKKKEKKKSNKTEIFKKMKLGFNKTGRKQHVDGMVRIKKK